MDCRNSPLPVQVGFTERDGGDRLKERQEDHPLSLLVPVGAHLSTGN